LIEARSGDQVEINVHNGVEQLGHPGVSIHWHGLIMKGMLRFFCGKKRKRKKKGGGESESKKRKRGWMHELSDKIDANEMDGVVGLTQCAIPSKESFTYRFRIPDDQAGTFW